VGRVVAEAAFLERTLAFMLDSMAHTDTGAVPLQTHQFTAYRLRTAALAAAKKSRLSPAELAELSLWLDGSAQLFELRNEIVHSHWLTYRRGVLLIEKYPVAAGIPPFRREWTLGLLRQLASKMAEIQLELERFHRRLSRERKVAVVQMGSDNVEQRQRWAPKS
jgi:hypothetical protein